MNKSDLSRVLREDLGLPIRKAEEIVDTVFEQMSQSLLNEDRIEIRGFGSFAVRDYPGYTGRNPSTGGMITVNDKKLPFFKPGKELRKRIDET